MASAKNPIENYSTNILNGEITRSGESPDLCPAAARPADLFFEYVV